MNESMVHLCRKLFQGFPWRLRATIYQRIIRPYRHKFPSLFFDAPLLLEPSARLRLSQSDSFHGEIAFCGIYENKVSCAIHQIGKNQGGMMVDVGANYGYYTLLWCAARKANRVAAVEAAPGNAKALRFNVERNRLADCVEVLEWAASHEEGSVSFNLASDEETGWGGIDCSAGSGHLRIEVPCHRLDAAFPEQDIEVLKIDCEGADAWVIEGAGNLLAGKRIRHVFFEENLHRQSHLDIESGTALRILERHGYQWEPLGDQPGLQNFHAWI